MEISARGSRVLVLLSLLALGHHASADSNGLLNDLSSLQNHSLGVLQASGNRTHADCNCDHAVDDAKASEESMKLRLDGAVKAADYCHHAQTMLTTSQQEKSLKTQKFVQSRVAEALKDEQGKIQAAKEELEQCKVAMSRPSCVEETMAVLKLKSSTAICTVKLAATQKQVAADKAAHEVVLDELTQDMQKLKNTAHAAQKKDDEDPSKDDQIDEMQQDIHILKAELQAKTKESSSARAALMSVKNHCQEEREELAESRDLSLSTASCLQLDRHSKAVCRIVGSEDLSCKHLGSLLEASCSQAPTKAEFSGSTEVTRDTPDDEVAEYRLRHQARSVKVQALSAKKTADYDEIQEDNNQIQSVQDLLQAEKLHPTHAKPWKHSQQKRIELAQVDMSRAQADRSRQVGMLKSLQPEATDSQVQMLQAQLTENTAQTDGDYALMQEYSSKKKAAEDLVRLAQSRGVASKPAEVLTNSLKLLKTQESKAEAAHEQDLAKGEKLHEEFAHLHQQ